MAEWWEDKRYAPQPMFRRNYLDRDADLLLGAASHGRPFVKMEKVYYDETGDTRRYMWSYVATGGNRFCGCARSLTEVHEQAKHIEHYAEVYS